MKERILILGAGVIGSTYAVKFSDAGHDMTVLARSRRLKELNDRGLLYSDEGDVHKAAVQVISELRDDDEYDLIFVAVRYEQIAEALDGLKDNVSGTIVTLVNSPGGYREWESLAGKGRIMPAFPGAGGKIVDGVLYCRLTPYLIQPTTFGELSGERTARTARLAALMRDSGIPHRICKDMEAWQKSHLAMVTPMANILYLDGGDNYSVARNKAAIRRLSLSLRENFRALKKAGIPITPFKLNIFRSCPLWLMDTALRHLYSTEFAELLMSSHAQRAKGEMLLLHHAFVEMLRERGIELAYKIEAGP